MTWRESAHSDFQTPPPRIAEPPDTTIHDRATNRRDFLAAPSLGP